ncbi:MAG: heme-dependent oxidative N-demethylase family protein [Pikeienuella sp.]
MELSHAPFLPFMSPRTAVPPGVQPLSLSDWIDVDEAYAPQMAYRERILAEHPGIVLMNDGTGAGREALRTVLASLAGREGFRIGETSVQRPDGIEVALDFDAPLATLCCLVQEDFLIHEKPEGEAQHWLKSGLLVFPSRWSLAEKMGRPLTQIHERVPGYNEHLAPRVQRFFDALKPERALVRGNWLVHSTPELFQPLTDDVKYAEPRQQEGRFWLRVERQSLIRLPVTNAVVFSVKTMITAVENLTLEQQHGLAVALDGQSVEHVEYHGGQAYHDAARAAVGALTNANP